MGWVQSPPTFCVMSETVCDVTNAAFNKAPFAGTEHRLESMAAADDDVSPSMEPRPHLPEDLEADARLQAVPGVTPLAECDAGPAPPSNKPMKRPLGDTDVFMDDFLQLGQGSPARMNGLRRHLLSTVDQVLAQPAHTEAQRTEALSLKKLLKGDGSWSTRKINLGWLVDTVRQTIELPAQHKEMLAEIFEDLAKPRECP